MGKLIVAVLASIVVVITASLVVAGGWMAVITGTNGATVPLVLFSIATGLSPVIICGGFLAASRFAEARRQQHELALAS